MTQNWRKLGLIYNPQNINSKLKSHAAVPVAEKLEGPLWRIYFNSRNENNQSSIFYLDYNIETKSIHYIQQTPLLEPGKYGFFDADGVMSCHFTVINNKRYLYYIGWNLGLNVPFRNALGIAEFDGNSLVRKFEGPVLDRSPFDPCFVASCCTIQMNNKYIMYYLSCFNWEKTTSGFKHHYNIKIAESSDGLSWKQTGKTAIDFISEKEYAISVPRVIIEDGKYKMWYSFRGSEQSEQYRIGYAESGNGYDWIRKDGEFNFIPDKSEWDSEMQCYPFIFDHLENRYLLYNGNEYGKTGFGIAILEK